MISAVSREQNIKIILAGSHGTGKTRFIWKFKKSEGEFQAKSTIGADFIVRDMEIEGQLYKVHLWDTAGQEAYHSITAPYFRNSSGVLLFFDITDQRSFTALDTWFKMIEEHTRVMPVVFVLGNKCDLENRVVSETAAQRYCRMRNVRYIETSAVNGANVDGAVESLVEEVVRQNMVNAATKQPEKRSGCC